MQVICLEEEAFYALVETVVSRLKEKSGVTHDRWISDEDAMHLLNIRSKTTLQKPLAVICAISPGSLLSYR